MVGDAVAVGGGVLVDVFVDRGALTDITVAFGDTVAVDVPVARGDGDAVTETTVGVAVCVEGVAKT
jgi:hypothetical protein